MTKKFNYKGKMYSYGELRKSFPLEYSSWKNMRTRCYNPKHDFWEQYGGRGIKVCSEWSSSGGDGFLNFLFDMGTRSKELSLDRIDNDKDYCRENCKWSTASEQTLNRGKFKSNTSGIAGVSWLVKNQTWIVYLNIGGRRIHLGCTSSLFEAACIRKSAELKILTWKL